MKDAFKKTKLILKNVVFLLFFYFMLRVGFFASNRIYFENTNALDILKAFLIGIRFDIAAIFIINIPSILLFIQPLRLERFKHYRHFLVAVFVSSNFLGILFNMVDFEYYKTGQRRLAFEPFTMFKDIYHMIPGVVKEFWPLFILLFVVIYLFFRIFAYISKKDFITSHTKFNSFTFRTIEFVIILMLTVICIRGGLQLRPIRQTNAFFSENKHLGYLALNSTYTITRSAFQKDIEPIIFMDDKTATSIFQSLTRSSSEKPIDEEYPVAREMRHTENFDKMNIVIFIMESWSNVYTNDNAPFFNSLIKEGLYFNNILANGQRSIEAPPSILASFPSLFASSLITSRSENNKLRGLGEIFKEQGYETSFHHGARTSSMGFDGFTHSIGFDHYYGKENFEKRNFPNINDISDGIWGIYDEYFFIDGLTKIAKFKKPFVSVFFSLHPHDPFKIPETLKNVFKVSPDASTDEKLKNAYKYSDFSVQRFFEEIKKYPFYENTLFVITGDHTSFVKSENVKDLFNVPLLFYSPNKKLNLKGISNIHGAHIDILPTILDILHYSGKHASIGKSLLEQDRNKNYSLIKYGEFYYYYKNKYYLKTDLNEFNELYDTETNSKIDDHERETQFSKEVRSIIQVTSTSISKNKIYY